MHDALSLAIKESKVKESNNQGQKCWTTRAYLSAISSTLHFNVDPHRTGMDSTMKYNIQTKGGKGEFHFEMRVCDKDSLSLLTKNLILVL